MKQPASKRSKAKTPSGRRGGETGSNEMNRATSADCEGADLGIAPKE
jgi:hypothetical protein